jgi:WD40 repeat protein
MSTNPADFSSPAPNPRERDIFLEALDHLVADERVAFLDRACGGDAALRASVEALLAAHTSDLLLTPGASPIVLSEGPGDKIGRYKLLEKIGEGGCGVVFMAEQTEPVRRRVALKVIRLGMDTAEVIARFEAERQALALMDHHNIARVFDAGTTMAGRPFFVMELVRGIPVTKFCDDNQLSTADRLKLFIAICQAVQHAHQKGVIHRDLKPSNILVTLHDGVPVPKVIDFGIAKATGGQLTDKTLFTAFAQFVGTPAYMSPEQAEMSSLDVDTRSDIYSLGVLLYELLTGRPPFDPAALAKAGVDEIRRQIREVDPPKPSACLSTLAAAALTTTAQQRHTEPPKLLTLVRGDLDWIVMRCLEKDRTRRYETANSLVADLQHHLADEPVTARPPSAAYLCQKIVRRNKLAFAAAAAVAASLIIGFGVATSEYYAELAAHEDASKQAQLAETDRDRLKVAQDELAQQIITVEKARQLAEQRGEETRRNLYAADMRLAADEAAKLGNANNGLTSISLLLNKWTDSLPDLRGWEWYYLSSLLHEDTLTIGAADNTASVAWSPDGARIASAGKDKTVTIWSANTGGELARLRGHTDEVTSVVWSPDGARLASASKDGTVKIWDARTAAEIRTLRGHVGGARSVSWSADGRRLASGGDDKTVRVWDVTNGTEEKSLPMTEIVQGVRWSHGSRLAVLTIPGDVAVWDTDTDAKPLVIQDAGNCITWSPDDRWLATGRGDFTVEIFNTATGRRGARLNTSSSGVASVAWSPDGNYVACGLIGSSEVILWSVSVQNAADGVSGTVHGSRAQILRGHLGTVGSLAWNSNGRQFVSAGQDGMLKIWDANAGNMARYVFHPPDKVNRLAWHPDGARLLEVNSRGQLWVWDLARLGHPVVFGGQRGWSVAAWNPDGTRLVAGGVSGINMWDTSRPALPEIWNDATSVQGLAWSPDGHRFATVGEKHFLRLWEVTSTGGVLQETLEQDVRNTVIGTIAWSPDGKKLAIASRNKVFIHEPASHKEPMELSGHLGNVRSLAWSNDSTRLASSGDDSTAKIWDGESGGLIHTLLGHGNGVYSVAWSPDDRRLATVAWDMTLRIWEPLSGAEMCSFEGEFSDKPSVVAWSPDGTRLVAGDIGTTSNTIGDIVVLDATAGLAAAGNPKAQTALPKRQAAAAARTEILRAVDSYRALATLSGNENVAAPLGETILAGAALVPPDVLGKLSSFILVSGTIPSRDLPFARRLAQVAYEATGGKDAAIADTYARALAMGGDFVQAVAVEKEAIALFFSGNNPGDDSRNAAFTARLRQYEAAVR